MGNVAVVYRILPDGVDTDLDDLISKIKSKIDVKAIQTEEIAFGLKCIKFTVILPDEENATKEIEEFLSNLEGVQSYEVVDMSLI